MTSHPILNINVAAANYQYCLAKITQAISSKNKKKNKLTIFPANVHLIMEMQTRPKLRKFADNCLVVPDGMPLAWLLNWFYASNLKTRVYGPDLTLKTLALANKKMYRIFLIGGLLGTTEKLKKIIEKKFSAVVVGHIDTPNRPPSASESEKFIKKINKSQADILLVGMGCPYQEEWIAQYRDDLDPPVVMAVGAAFDFISGRIKQAPSWMQNAGLEWLYRVLKEPSRLAHRYLIYNPLFILKVIKNVAFTGRP